MLNKVVLVGKLKEIKNTKEMTMDSNTELILEVDRPEDFATTNPIKDLFCVIPSPKVDYSPLWNNTKNWVVSLTGFLITKNSVQYIYATYLNILEVNDDK